MKKSFKEQLIIDYFTGNFGYYDSDTTTDYETIMDDKEWIRKIKKLYLKMNVLGRINGWETVRYFGAYCSIKILCTSHQYLSCGDEEANLEMLESGFVRFEHKK